MTTALIFSSRRPSVYRKLKRQVVAEFSEELRGKSGWKREWVRWKRVMVLQIRYNELLFVKNKIRIPAHPN
ncbi:hypothetical protein [Spirosoma flavus]